MAKSRKKSYLDEFLHIEEERNKFVAKYMRRLWVRWPERKKAMNAVKKRKYRLKKDGKGFTKAYRSLYKCERCREHFYSKDVSVHHIVQVGNPGKTNESLLRYLKRLFCDYMDLRVLCKKCHQMEDKQCESGTYYL